MRFLPELPNGHLYLLLAPRPLQRPLLNEFIARLASQGELQVLVCGNRFDAHDIARRLRRYTEMVDAALGRIHLARAFTCYQVLSLLRHHRLAVLPTIVTDLPDMFYDESVCQKERLKLFQQSLEELQMLSRRVQTLISAIPSAHPARQPFLDLLQAQAETIWQLEAPVQVPLQLRLF